ncbi:rRNA maturation RNase YbeY [bacterium]|nr:rRNA maturation RNase YbeY [bacterium]
MLEIVDFTQRNLDLEKLKKKLEEVLKELNLKEKKIVFYLVGASRMRRLNKKFRKKNRVTTVLSFSSPKEFVYPKGKEIFGEIFLCPSYIKKIAIRTNLDFWQYLLEIAIHGVLHLLGFEHQNEKEAKIFKTKEKEILKKILKL